MERNPKFITLLHFLLGDEFDSYMASQGTPIKISPLDILGFRRDHPDLFYEHLLNRKNHKPMKKYRVVTDNLDWVGIEKGTEMEFGDKSFSVTYKTTSGDNISVVTPKEFDDNGYFKAFKSHPDWFEEIKEEPKEFTREDLINCADVVRLCNQDENPPDTITIVNRWIELHTF